MTDQILSSFKTRLLGQKPEYIERAEFFKVRLVMWREQYTTYKDFFLLI